MKKTIIFHENQLTYRGTSTALFDYAYYNQTILGNESIILYNTTNPNNYPEAVVHFQNHFKVIGYQNSNEIDDIVIKHKADVFYAIKSGENDGIIAQHCKSCIHVVFKNFEPHGNVYAYVSNWLAQTMSNGKCPHVPHIVHLPEIEGDLRNDLGIPQDAIVFGRHGGAETFDIPFVKKTVKKIALKNKNIYFVFLGTNSFVKRTFFRKYKNIIFLPPTTNINYKVKFINSCNAYLHARTQGESFGIAVGEFSIKNKPVITWKHSDEKSHLEILADKAIVYENEKDLYQILKDFKPNTNINYDCYSAQFSPEVVMQKFKAIFIDD